jgi:hypothetical protein
MPSTSKKQHNFMAAVANNPSFAKKVGVPQSVGKDFNEADKGRKFSKGGDTMATKMNSGFMAMIAKKKAGAKPEMPLKKMAEGGVSESGGRGVTTVPGDKKLGSPSRYVTKILPSGSKPLTGQRPEKEGAGFKRGGMPSALAKHAAKPASKAHAGLKGGGYVKAADGVAQRGKTRAQQFKMKSGGMAC